MKGAFQSNWEEYWFPELRVLLNGDETDLELLSESIRDVFLSASGSGRSPEQADTQWRRFIWCVLSVLSTDGDELAVLGSPMSKRVLPDWIRQRLRITIGEERGLSHDPDLVLIGIHRPQGLGAGSARMRSDSLREYLETGPETVSSITVIWTKTNFNDLIQQPMLWARISTLHQRGYNPEVRHAWVTVPSQRPEVFSPGTAPFNRAATFNAGSYWGLGRRPEFGMGSIFDMIPDWEERMPSLRTSSQGSVLCKELGLVD